MTSGCREEAQEAALDERVRLERAIAGSRGRLDGLGEHAIGPAQVAAQSLHDADVGDEVDCATDRPPGSSAPRVR